MRFFILFFLVCFPYEILIANDDIIVSLNKEIYLFRENIRLFEEISKKINKSIEKKGYIDKKLSKEIISDIDRHTRKIDKNNGVSISFKTSERIVLKKQKTYGEMLKYAYDNLHVDFSLFYRSYRKDKDKVKNKDEYIENLKEELYNLSNMYFYGNNKNIIMDSSFYFKTLSRYYILDKLSFNKGRKNIFEKNIKLRFSDFVKNKNISKIDSQLMSKLREDYNKSDKIISKRDIVKEKEYEEEINKIISLIIYIRYMLTEKNLLAYDKKYKPSEVLISALEYEIYSELINNSSIDSVNLILNNSTSKDREIYWWIGEKLYKNTPQYAKDNKYFMDDFIKNMPPKDIKLYSDSFMHDIISPFKRDYDSLFSNPKDKYNLYDKKDRSKIKEILINIASRLARRLSLDYDFND